jgi:hypothetical protein
MRFLAPSRDAVDPDIFDQPVFSGLGEFRDLLVGSAWPDIAALNERLQPLQHCVTGQALTLVAQDDLTEPLHYESRIFERGEIATRSRNWHDLLNALVWKKFPAIKSALNTVQAQTIARIGAKQRTREQDALTQFDEAGALLVLRDRRLLALWDAHDWSGLFLRQREAWRDGRISLAIFGHALFEHALRPDMLLVAKTLVFVADDDTRAATTAVDALGAAAIGAQECLRDPQRLRPLPLSGIPGWHHRDQDERFYAEAGCFRPLRSGREYPTPLAVPD